MGGTVFGVIGGYGSTGRVVLSELHKSCEAQILVGGRDLAKANALAAEYSNRVTAGQVDAFEARSLDEFCDRCSIVVNCAGPVKRLQDRVAQAAFRNRRHYVDLAGMTFIKERMLPHASEIADRGLSFVVSAGWTPGLTELLPVYAHEQARSQMDSVELLTVFYSDSGEWSASALRDGVWFLRRTGLPKPGYFRKGEWVRAGMTGASRKLHFGAARGARRFSLFTMPETIDLGRQLNECDVFVYTYVPGFRNMIAVARIALLPVKEEAGIRLLGEVFRRNRLSVRGFVVAVAVGRSGGQQRTFRSQIVFRDGQDYWINGIVPATVARLIAEGRIVRPGLNYLSAAVDPIAFMAELRKAGVQQTEDWNLAGMSDALRSCTIS